MSLISKIKARIFLSHWKKDNHLQNRSDIHVHRSYQAESIYIDLYWSTYRIVDGHQKDHQRFYTRATYSNYRDEILRNEQSIAGQYTTP